jgi:hypothetical protein
VSHKEADPFDGLGSTFGKGRDFLKYFEVKAASYTIRTGSFSLTAKAAGATAYDLPSSSVEVK